MSTVLWANIMVEGKVESDESDKYALYKYAKKLNKLTKKLKVTEFKSAQDFTDMRINLSQDELPDGMDSTDELMATKGTWVSGSEAAEMLEKLIVHISDNEIKFGFFYNDMDEVIDELKDSLVFANKAKTSNGSFNFSVVA